MIFNRHICAAIALLLAAAGASAQPADPLRVAVEQAVSTNPEVAARFNAYRASVDAFRKATGESVYVWLTQLEMVSVLTELGRLDEAERLSAEATAALGKMSKEGSYESAYSGSVVGELRYAQARYAEAVTLQRQAIDVLARIYDENHAELAQMRAQLAASLNATRTDDARREAAQLLETAKAALERGGDDSSGPMLGAVYLERSRLRRDTGDLPGARADIVEAARRLQAAEHFTKLRNARALAKELGVSV
jgi:tetratricopeptide (TPR) repeat protein